MLVYDELKVAFLERLNTQPATELAAGRFFHNTTSKGLEWYDGTIWHETVDLASTQSLSGKTLVEPVIDNFADFNEESAPSSPASGKLRVYAKADKKLYKKDSDGLESEVGSGGAGGGRNYLSDWADATKDIGTVTNSLTDVVDTSDRTANKTTWGSSDTSLLTIARSSSSPLRQSYSYLITEAGSSAGAFVESPLFNLDAVDLGKPVTVSFDVSGNSTSDYYQAYICRYDSSNVLKERILIAGTASATSPYSAQIPTGTVNFQGFFIPSSTSTDQYALRIVSNNNSADSIKIDSLYVGPQQVVQGAAITDWQDASQICHFRRRGADALDFTTSSSVRRYVRMGDSIYISGEFVASSNGSGTTADDIIELYFDGLGIDFSKMPTTGDFTGRNTVGSAIWFDATVAKLYTANVDGGSSRIRFFTNGSALALTEGDIGNGDTFGFQIGPIPIVGWSSNVTMANRAVEEYASNSDTSGNDNTTSFAYGASGNLVPNRSVGTAVTKRVRFQTSIQPTDAIILEVLEPSAPGWINWSDRLGSWMKQGSSDYGVFLDWVNATDVDVKFEAQGYAASNATYAGNGSPFSTLFSSGWKWRVRKVSGGASVGYPIAAENIVGGISAGMLIPFAGSTAPFGWLLCYGQQISRTAYATLFSVIGTTYGVGDGSTTFNLPDLRGRTIAALDNMGGSDAGRLNWANTLGTTGGTQTHTLAESEIPSHSHVVTNVPTGSAGATALWPAAGSVRDRGTPTASAASVQSAGGGGAHNNMQPTILLNYIIKT